MVSRRKPSTRKWTQPGMFTSYIRTGAQGLVRSYLGVICMRTVFCKVSQKSTVITVDNIGSLRIFDSDAKDLRRSEIV